MGTSDDVAFPGDSPLLDWAAILSLVFGGCCSNVFALEAVLKSHPSAGIFLTFVQFLYVACSTLSTQVTFTGGLPRFKTRVVPLKRWAGQVVMFLAVSLLNNLAFGLKVPVPVHIIFRSGGLCVSMVVGWLAGKKRYSGSQVLSVMLVTVGIIVATASAPPKPKGKPPSIQHRPATTASTNAWGLADNTQYVIGVAILSLALVISAFMGLFQEKTYSKYGRGGAVWQESIFYSHTLSLPLLVPFLSNMSNDFAAITNTPPTVFRIPMPPGILPNKYPGSPTSNVLAVGIPSAWIAFAMNIFTQGLCINGVNRLTSRVSSVSVNLILTVRKAVSLGISVWYYGAGFNKGLTTGAAMVLVGTVLYSMAPSPAQAEQKAKIEPVDVISTADISIGRTTATQASHADLKQRQTGRFTEVK
ncbi:hypothetical protein FFLO_03219 [Filobasidium floriforme]|uniref:Uncharacterized protein n=1 Tax=Filobasidium floriforme TaxID=5210 RepID=A0A8K0JL88_9TREE|nr:hypothetical protein FFLO_03219 [Filobasidium floriforme]